MRARAVVFTADAVRQYKKLPKAARPILREAIRRHLMDEDPTATTRNKFRLRRASEQADYELRVDDWRIFYRVDDTVTVTLLGRKSGSRLIVEGEELKL